MQCETECQLENLRSLFGNTRGFGVNDTKSRIGKSNMPCANSANNVVKGSAESNAFKLRTSSEGLNYMHDADSNRLTIKVRGE